MKFNENITRLRRITQTGAFVFILAVPVLNLFNFTLITGTYYSFSIGSLVIIDPALIIQFILINKVALFTVIVSGLIPLLLALLLGKVFCSWICPFNLISELTHSFLQKFRITKGINKNPPSQIYWTIALGIFLITMISGIPFITLFSLPGLISAQTADAVLWGKIAPEILILLIILLIEAFVIPRFWCKYICPSGAILALFKTKNTLNIRFIAQKCKIQCSDDKFRYMCNVICPLNLNPRKENIYPYCFNCGACVEMCNLQGGKALEYKTNTKKMF